MAVGVGVGNGERRATRKGEKRFGSLLLLRVSSKESGRKVLFMIGFARGVGGAKGIGSASRIYRKSSKLPRNLSQSENIVLFICISGPRESRAGVRLVRVRAEERAVRSVLEVQSVEEGGTPLTSE